MAVLFAPPRPRIWEKRVDAQEKPGKSPKLDSENPWYRVGRLGATVIRALGASYLGAAPTELDETF